MSLSKKSAIFAMILLTGCSGGWFGSNDKKEKIKGERISVLNVGQDVRVDATLKDEPVTTPEAEYNSIWPKSSSHDSVMVQNPQAAKSFNKKNYIGIGKGANGDAHITVTPVVGGERLYTLDARGRVTAFDAKNVKHKLWTYKIKVDEEKGDFTSGGLLYSKGKIYIATGYNFVIALAADTGNELWNRKITSLARSAPAGGDGVVVVNTIDNISYGLDSEDGSVIWNHSGTQVDVSVIGSASPTVENGVAYVPYSSGELYALQLSSGNEMWVASLTDANGGGGAFTLPDIDSSPIVKDGRIYGISSDGVFAAMDAHSGGKIWEAAISSSNQPWLAGGYLYVLDNTNEVLCVSAKNGAIKWITRLPSYKNEERKTGYIDWQGPVMAGGNILVVNSKGNLWSLSPQTGEIIEKNKVSKEIYSTPVVANNDVYLVDDDADMLVLRGKIEDAKPQKAEEPEPAVIKVPEKLEEKEESLPGPGVGKKGEKVELKEGEVELVLPEDETEKDNETFLHHFTDGVKKLFRKRQIPPETEEGTDTEEE